MTTTSARWVVEAGLRLGFCFGVLLGLGGLGADPGGGGPGGQRSGDEAAAADLGVVVVVAVRGHGMAWLLVGGVVGVAAANASAAARSKSP